MIAGILTFSIATVVAPAADYSVTDADYAAAAKELEGNLQGLVRNESVQPHWLDASGRFWYRRDGSRGPEFVVVTSDGKKTPAFDHAALGRAIVEQPRALWLRFVEISILA
jgi:dipeptidyl-peptidase 4